MPTTWGTNGVNFKSEFKVICDISINCICLFFQCYGLQTHLIMLTMPSWNDISVTDTTECAEKCVNTAPESIVTGGTFRGFEFLCDTGQCRCLYDAGTLSTRSSRGYKRTKTNQGGVGPIAKTVPKSDRYCAKLVEAELLEIAIG